MTKNKKTDGTVSDAAMGLLGAFGGKATLKRYGPDHFRKIAQKGLKKRWAKKGLKTKSKKKLKK